MCVQHNSSTCHVYNVYVMWAVLGHSHFLHVPAVSTNGNGTGTKNVLEGTVSLDLCSVSSLLSTVLLQ